MKLKEFLSGMTMEELRYSARELSFKGYSKLKKEELVDFLVDKMSKPSFIEERAKNLSENETLFLDILVKNQGILKVDESKVQFTRHRSLNEFQEARKSLGDRFLIGIEGEYSSEMIILPEEFLSYVSQDSESVSIEKNLYDEINEFAKNQNLGTNQATKKLIEKGLEEQAPKQCKICKQIASPTVLEECQDCGDRIHCGYVKIHHSSEWKGETWTEDPIVTCYMCFFSFFIDSDEISSFEEYKKEFDELIQGYIDNFGAESGRGITTKMILNAYDINEPNTWEYLDEYVREYFRDFEDDEEA